MFYNDVLLRKGGKFYLYWLADFYPRRFNSSILKKQVWQIDIRKSCDELREVITSESGTVSKKFSLRLSSHLVRGLTRLYAKKVNLFLDYLCTFSATIYHQTNKLNIEDTSEREPPIRRKRRRVTAAPTLHVTANDVIEQIQNTNNMVVRLEDITIREDNLPSIVVPNDGFGEDLVPPEVMRATDTSHHQVSRLELEQTDRSKDVTDLLHLTGRMEILQEVDDFNAKKSGGADLIMPFDLGKEIEIPQIPEILPEIPKDPVVTHEEVTPVQRQLERTADFDLESLEDINEADNLRRRKRRSLIVDKCIMFSGKYMKKRLENINIEQRHATFKDAVVKLDKVASYLLLRQPAVGNLRARADCQRYSCSLTDLFVRNLVVSGRVHAADRELETMLRHRNLESINENEILQIGPPTVEDITKVVEDSHRNIYSPVKEVEASMRVTESPIKEVTDPIRMSDQDISAHQMVVTADVHRTLDEDVSPPPTKKRKFDSDKRQTRSQGAAQRSSAHTTAAAELMPAPVPEILQPDPAPVYNDQQVDVAVQDTNVTRTSGDSNEPQLGSLDRTKVSVDTHHGETELKRYLNEHWGSEALFTKIIQLRRKDQLAALDVRSLLQAHCSRLAAAKCFSTLLKLSQHNFVKLVKNDETSEISNILLTNEDLIV